MTAKQIEDAVCRIQDELRQLFDEDRRLGEIVRARTLGDPDGWQYRREWEGNLERVAEAHKRLPALRQEIDSKRAEFIRLVERWHAAMDAEHARRG